MAATVIDISDTEEHVAPPPAKRQRSANGNAFPQHLTDFVPPTVIPLFTAIANAETVPAKAESSNEGGVSTNANQKSNINSIHDSYTYLSSIPEEIKKNSSEPIILGIDEAGRGPVLGPMVYSLAYCLEKNLKILNENDFDDSKKLTDLKRTELLYAICNKKKAAAQREISDDIFKSDSTENTAEQLSGKEIENFVTERQEPLFHNIGYGITTLTARDISSEMLNSMNFNNLNNQAHETTIELIKKILKVLSKVLNPVTEIYIDTVGPPATYQEKLQKLFPTLKVTVSKKADSLFPIVSCASVVAKVTRDIILKKHNLLEKHNAYGDTAGIASEYGSGYPSDPRTTAWLNGKINAVFGWDQVVRYSWQTTKTLLNNKSNVKVIWEDDIRMKKIEYQGKSGNVFGLLKKDQNANDLLELEVSTLWYGDNVSSI